MKENEIVETIIKTTQESVAILSRTLEQSIEAQIKYQVRQEINEFAQTVNRAAIRDIVRDRFEIDIKVKEIGYGDSQ